MMFTGCNALSTAIVNWERYHHKGTMVIEHTRHLHPILRRGAQRGGGCKKETLPTVKVQKVVVGIGGGASEANRAIHSSIGRVICISSLSSMEETEEGMGLVINSQIDSTRLIRAEASVPSNPMITPQSHIANISPRASQPGICHFGL
jgi:hypothetical protein